MQPDLVAVATERLWTITEESIQGPPDLVIEILSPSTAGRDRTVKLDRVPVRLGDRVLGAIALEKIFDWPG